MKELVALLLAGGAGKRFWPLTTYKARLPFLGKPLIQFNLEKLGKSGVKEAVIVTNPQDEEIMQRLALPNLRLEVVVQPQALGMGDAILRAKELINGRPCLVMNADDLVEQSLFDRIKEEVDKGQPFVVGKKVETYYDLGYLRFAGKRLVEIVEKPGQGKEPSDLVNLVFHYFPHVSRLLTILDSTSNHRDDMYERALSQLIGQSEVKVLEYQGRWQALKYPWQVLGIMEFLWQELRPRQGKNVEISDNVTIEGMVTIEDNVKILENTKIIGPCYIGRDTIIGSHNLIRQSHLGRGCVTGFNTDITRSYIGDNCWFHGNYVGDSVLEGNVSLGSGTVLANLRLDEGEIFSQVKGERVATGRRKLGAIIAKDGRLGVNTSLMPGVKIGTNSFIGAGLTIDRDVPDNTFCYGKSELVLKKNERSLAADTRDSFRQKL